jgi:hypothetical protein
MVKMTEYEYNELLEKIDYCEHRITMLDARLRANIDVTKKSLNILVLGSM